MSPNDPIDDDQVHVLHAGPAGRARRSRLSLILGVTLLLALAGAGGWLWLHPELLAGLGGGPVANAPAAAPGNLLADAWSFETTEGSSASQAWSVPDEAPAGFEFRSSGAVTGELGAVAPSGEVGEVGEAGEQGWCRILTDKPHALGAHRGAVSLSAVSASRNVQLLLRFEGTGRPPLDVVVASGEGRIAGSAPVPPGYSSVRAGLQCLGEGSADDLDLRLVNEGTAALERRGIFDVLAQDPGALVFRGDELVLEVAALTARAGESAPLPPAVAAMPGEKALALADGTRLTRQASHESQGSRLLLRESVQGAPGGLVLVRTLVVHGSLAGQPVGVVSARGFEQFTGDFRVEGARSLVLGRTQDRLACEFGADVALSGSWLADGSVLVRSETDAAAGGEQELALQTSFQDERVAAAQHRDAALAAEKEGRLGAALAEAETITTRYPHDEEVLAQAMALRGRAQGVMQQRLDAIDRNLEDALFLASAARCREVLAECLAAAALFEGSDLAARFEERAQTVASRAAVLLEEDRARRAGSLQAVATSFRQAGGYDTVAAEIEAYLQQHLQPGQAAAGAPAEGP